VFFHVIVKNTKHDLITVPNFVDFLFLTESLTGPVLALTLQLGLMLAPQNPQILTYG
jgi:hypothetical protein